jgi:nitrile hydratase accessory protein
VTAERVLDADGPAAPPRRNGELVFAAPWESRLFGMTLALHEAGHFAWDEFRARLIVEIARRDRDPGWRYYVCWAAALEDLLAAKGLCRPADLAVRERTLAAREPGHDHRVRS